jgi:hypothetical protein
MTLPPNIDSVREALIRKGREAGLCCSQSPNGKVCLEPDGHDGKHRATDLNDEVTEEW